jgi:hypothetical protein
MTGMSDDEEDQAIAEIETWVPTAQIPSFDFCATKAATWVTSPSVMLADLCETLDRTLSICRTRYGDRMVFEVDWNKFPDDSFGMATVEFSLLMWGFSYDEDIIKIRHAIEPTTIDVSILRNVRDCFNRITGQPPIPWQSIIDFTEAVRSYQRELKSLANWIEAKAILNGKSDGTGAISNVPKTRATPMDIDDAARQIEAAGVTATKERVRTVLKQRSLAISSEDLNRILKQRSKAKTASPR